MVLRGWSLSDFILITAHKNHAIYASLSFYRFVVDKILATTNQTIKRMCVMPWVYVWVFRLLFPFCIWNSTSNVGSWGINVKNRSRTLFFLLFFLHLLCLCKFLDSQGIIISYSHTSPLPFIHSELSVSNKMMNAEMKIMKCKDNKMYNYDFLFSC